MRKIVRATYIVLLMIIFFVTFIILKKVIVKDIDNNKDEIETTERWWRTFENHNELAYWVAIKNGDWSDLHLTDVFRKKYNEKDGIFGDMQFDKVEYRPYHDGKYPFEDFAYLVITQGKKKTAYTYSLDPSSSGDGYNDVIIGDVYPLTDEKGNELDFRVGITEKNFFNKMDDLAWGHEEEQLVGVTDHFHKKYPYFLDLFIHYSPLTFNHIEFVPERSSWERKEAYFIVNSQLECKKRYYKVKFTLDNRGYLDDAKVNKVNDEEYVGNYDEIAAKLEYENSNWDELKITDNYRKKFNGQSYNPDIKKINIDYDVKSEYVEKGNYNEYLLQYTMQDGTTSVYHIKYIMDENGYIDDIECNKLNYDNIPIKEAKELYLKDHNIQR